MTRNLQQEMPLLGEVRRPELVADELIRACRHRLDAIRLCVHLSGMSNDELARRLGIDPGHWTRIMQGRAWFPDPKSVDLMHLCGNYAPLQYEAQACKFRLVKVDHEEEIRDLRARLAALEGRVAA